MYRATDACLAELGLECSGLRSDQWGDDPGSKIRRTGLDHKVLHGMLAEAGAERVIS